MRVVLAGNPSFDALLERVAETVLESLDHQEFPFEQIVDAVRPARQAGVNPLAQVNFRVRVDPPPTLDLLGATTSNVPIDVGFAAFDLALDLRMESDRIVGEFIYDTDLFDRSSVERLAAQYEALIRQVVDRPHQRLLAFDLPTEQSDLGTALPEAPLIRRFRETNAPRSSSHVDMEAGASPEAATHS